MNAPLSLPTPDDIHARDDERVAGRLQSRRHPAIAGAAGAGLKPQSA